MSGTSANHLHTSKPAHHHHYIDLREYQRTALLNDFNAAIMYSIINFSHLLIIGYLPLSSLSLTHRYSHIHIGIHSTEEEISLKSICVVEDMEGKNDGYEIPKQRKELPVSRKFQKGHSSVQIKWIVAHFDVCNNEKRFMYVCVPVCTWCRREGVEKRETIRSFNHLLSGLLLVPQLQCYFQRNFSSIVGHFSAIHTSFFAH